VNETIEAIYENGVFRPTQPVTGLPEHARVRVTVLSPQNTAPWADCVGIMPDEDAREIRRIIDEEFETVDPNDW
jgi:predicted DNA-binding antitoxin AbrB/MazE fold protein